MFYILDNLGYIEEVSTHYIERDNKTCTEYTGAIPEGYETLADWVLNANIRAYKITNGNLVYDANRDAALQAEYNAKLLPNEFILYESTSGSTGTTNLSDNAINYKYLEIFYTADGIFGSVKVEPVETRKFSTTIIYSNENNYQFIFSSTFVINGAKLTWFSSRNNYIADANNVASYGSNPYVKIRKVIGYK